ncbi:MAG: glycosyltransferase family 39 protein [Acidobacteriaceae bacterium]|nr:glycosyltransferase family 39 protein [Acidobacteriaceae bacterium]
MDQPVRALKKSLAKDKQRTSLEQWAQVYRWLIALVILCLGFVLRLEEAWGTFLNPDEALHFFIADRPSLEAVYKASLTQAHPPLFFFMLHGLRSLGNSEIILRLPSFLAGTLFCWVFFKWLDDIFGPQVALVGVVFAALLPTMIGVTAEVRQYGLLLLFLMSGLWFLDRGVRKNSPPQMFASAVCLWLAMLTHYSSFFFVAVLAIYASLRIWRNKVSRPTAVAWLSGQLAACSLAVLLYVRHISKIKATTMTQQAFEIWLRRSYFHSGDNPLIFLVTRTFSVFQYTVGQLVVGDALAIVFLAGVIFLLLRKKQMRSQYPSALAVLLMLPFVLNYIAGLLDLYPFGGTRHCVYLSIFAITGIAIGIVELAGQNLVRATVISVVVVILCFAFRSVHHPYIARADQARSHMDEAVVFVQTQISTSQTILVDYQSGIELSHYLCKQQQIVYDRVTPDFLVFNCANHRIISTVSDLWAFTPQTFLEQARNLLAHGYLEPGERVWVCQAGWIVNLNEDLRNFPGFQNLKTQRFGNNIRIFSLLVGGREPGQI